MSSTKKPQDFKKSAKEPLSFVYDGETYTFAKPVTIGLVRKFRNEPEEEAMFSLLEEVAGDEALTAIDQMDVHEFADFWKTVIGANMGES